MGGALAGGLMMALAMLVGLLTYERVHALMQSYGAALVFSMIGISLYRADFRADRIYWVGLALTAWYALTRVLNGDHYLQYSYNQYRVVCMTATYSLAFPLAAMLGDEEKRRALDRIAVVLTAALAAVCWLGVIAALRGEVITIPFFESEFGIMEDGRLWVLSQHPNFTAAASLCGLFMLIYLVVSHWKPWVLIPAARGGRGPVHGAASVGFAHRHDRLPAGCGHCGSGRLSASAHSRQMAQDRGDRVPCAHGGRGGRGGLWRGGQGGIHHQRWRTGHLPALAAGRPGHPHGRTGVYGAVPATFAQHPFAIFKGFDELEMMAAVNKNVGIWYDHMHNSFLQTLMLTGVPGLLAALWLTWRIASATVRVLFARGGEVSSAQKLLVLLPVALFVQGMLEHYLFVDSYSILNFLFFLFSGYVVQLSRRVSWKQAFPRLARRAKA